MQPYEAQGMHLLGFAYRDDVRLNAEIADQIGGLIWLGFVAIADPIREDVPAAIAACRRAQVQRKIVTGDNPITAEAIALPKHPKIHPLSVGTAHLRVSCPPRVESLVSQGSWVTVLK